ncbi:hypothetical protein [Candidiatus Paracoxiella cheracis]|uniref:hypothetical protein n=1 Tax=Candidiatus Paracoxiella cheracis TaxID=3405120 RepID=UPI003BF5470F
MKKIIKATLLMITTVGITPFALASTQSQALHLVNEAKQLAAGHKQSAGGHSMYIAQPAQQIAQEALSYGKTQPTHGLQSISPTDCVKVVQTLITDSTSYAAKAEAGQYKKVGNVDGNLVMCIMASAATIAGTSLTSFNVCGINAMAGYDTASVLDMSLKITDKNFS